MGHHHHHHHHGSGTGRRLMLSLWMTLAFVALEVFAGVRAHSLALLSDAGHNFTDALALGLAAFAFRLEHRPANEIKTFGYQRAGVLAAFVNALTLVALSGFIFYEGYQRLLHPEPVGTGIMGWVAGAGLILNAGIMFALQQQKEHDINVRAAWIHMLGDALGAIAIIAGAALIRMTGWLEIDPILSIGIAALIIWSALGIIKESLNILLEGLPAGLELKAVARQMRQVEGVIDVHDLHIWTLGTHAHALSCHVLIEDMPTSASQEILRRLNGVLHDRYQIDHTTVQFEHTKCAMQGNCCDLVEEKQPVEIRAKL